jgi:hypothetical protein
MSIESIKKRLIVAHARRVKIRFVFGEEALWLISTASLSP